MFCGCLTNRALNSAHELLFCAVSLKGSLASQSFSLIERILKCTEVMHPCHNLQQNESPVMTCTGIERIVLLFTALARIRPGNFNEGLDLLRFGN